MTEKLLSEYLIEQQVNIRFWNTDTEIVQLSGPQLLYVLLGDSVTLADVKKCYSLPSVKNGIDSKFTIMMNKDKGVVVCQKVPSHKRGRDCITFFVSGVMTFIDGNSYERRK